VYILCMKTVLALSERLLLCRRYMNLTQLELSERSGVSRSYIAQVERATITNVGIEPLTALAKALNVTVSYLIGESEEVPGDDAEDFNLSEEEGEALRLLRSMGEGDREQAMGVLRRLGRTPQLVELDELLKALTTEIGVERLSVVLGRLMVGSVNGPGDK